MTDPEAASTKVGNRVQFVQFVRVLLSELEEQKYPWTNDTLISFLEGLAGWVEDADDGNARNINWKFMCDMLLAARFYE